MRTIACKPSKVIICIVIAAVILVLTASSGIVQEAGGYGLGWSSFGGIQGRTTGSGYDLLSSSGRFCPGVLAGGDYTLTTVMNVSTTQYVILYGDVAGNGQVDVGDAILVLRHIVGLIDIEDEFGPDALVRAKVSGGDGDIDVGDAILILRYIVGLITEFPVEG